MKVKRTDKTWEQYRSRLYGMGWEHAGDGSFGTCLVKGGKAIKIMRRVDFGYYAFVRKVMRLGRRSQWLPRIHAAHRMLSVPVLRCGGCSRFESEFVVVLMEALEPIGDGAWVDVRRQIQAYSVERLWPEWGDIILSDTRARRILRMLGTAYGFDWHSGNVMRRPGTDEIVITDPVYSFRNTAQRIRV